MNAIEPLVFVLNDGREAKFLLSFAQIREATAGTVSGVDNRTAFGTELLARSLYIGMLDKDDMAFAEFESLLPPDPELLQGFYEALRKHCGMSQNEKYRPQKSQTTQ